MENTTELSTIVAQLRELIASPQRSNVQRLAYSVDETADALGVTRRVVEGLIDRQEIRAKRIGRALYIARGEIDRFLASQ